MKEKYIKNLPKWYNDNNAYDLVLSNDLDGVVSASALSYARGNWEVQYFYDFKNLYVSEQTLPMKNKSARRIWADVAITVPEKCFDNHVCRANTYDKKNDLCINPNLLNNVTNTNYFSKYCGSTALVIWSVYGLPLPKSELGKMLLLTIDTGFKGFYSPGIFSEMNRFYLCDMLGFDELYEVQKRHSKNEFYELIERFHLSQETEINDGFLRTGLDLDFLSEQLGIEISIPEGKRFVKLGSLEKHSENNFFGLVKNIKNLYTLAYVRKNNVMFSTY